jgi:hypothetical protein
VAGGGRSSADSALVAALAGGSTIEDAARRAGVSARTAYRRVGEPDFRKRVTEVRAEMLSQSVGALTVAARAAVHTLMLLMQPIESSSVRLGAAKAVLELGAKLRESEHLEHRVAELEAQQLARQPEGGLNSWAA